MDQVPAFVIGRRTDVLASNRLAARSPPTSTRSQRPNLARYHTLDAEARERAGDWEQIAAETMAMLHLEAGRCPQDHAPSLSGAAFTPAVPPRP